MVGKERQGWAIFAVMGILFLVGTFTFTPLKAAANPAFAELPIDRRRARSTRRNMEGKEVALRHRQSSLFTNRHDRRLRGAGQYYARQPLLAPAAWCRWST